MARIRTYKLPNGKKTKREGCFKKQWTEFVKPVAKALKLKIGHFDSSEAELLEMWKKGNKKEVPTQRITLPHWLTYRIQCRFNGYIRQIQALLKERREMRDELTVYRAYFQESIGGVQEAKPADETPEG
jgi:hypothetical protein